MIPASANALDGGDKVRGTGVYLEAGPEHPYFCTCYGEVDVQTVNDPDSNRGSVHHDKPLYTYGRRLKMASIGLMPIPL